MLRLLKNIIKKVIFTFIKPPVKFISNSYAQAGEDCILNFLFASKGIKKPSYLELGVYKPDIGSNTFLFYQQGSRGVCVEADPSLINNIKLVRNEDIILNIGVGDSKEEEADFYIFDEPSLNTMDKDEAKSRQEHGTFKISEIKRIKITGINRIIEQNFHEIPHLISIDIEGLDLVVLKSLDFKRFPIPVVCVETCSYSENHIKPKDFSIQDFMLNKGYFIYADTYLNTIFVREDWFYKV